MNEVTPIPDTLQYLLSEGTKTGFSTVEAFGEKIAKQEYECFPDEPASLHTVETQRVTVRAFREIGNPVGFTLSKPGSNSIKSAFLNIYGTHLPDQKENYHHQLPSTVKEISPTIFDNSSDTIDIHAFNELIDRINEIIISPPFQGLKLKKIHLSKTLKKTYIANTNHLDARYKKTNFNLVLTFMLGANRIDISENRVFFSQLEPYKIISRAFNLLNSLTETPETPVTTGKNKNLYLILSPEASAFILKEFSPYFKIRADREMMNINYPAILNIVDNPFMDGQAGSVPFDDEGVQTRGQKQGVPAETSLVRKGVFSQVITDLASAFRTGSPSTGNGFRNDRFPFPSVQFSNLFIKPTVLPLKNLMTDANEGVLVSLLKLKAIDKKGYLFSAYGYRFKGGDMQEPVHVYFKTTFRSYLLHILKVSKEIKFFCSAFNIGSPYILCAARNKEDNVLVI
jgi:predicted Zn-dependent protease